jgi:hypothetical protein
VNPNSLIKAILEGVAHGSDDIAEFVAKNGDEIAEALRSGRNVDDIMRTAPEALKTNTLFMRTMAKVGENIKHLDEIEKGLISGRRLDSADDLLKKLGLEGGDDATRAARNAIKASVAEFNEQAARVAGLAGDTQNLRNQSRRSFRQNFREGRADASVLGARNWLAGMNNALKELVKDTNFLGPVGRYGLAPMLSVTGFGIRHSCLLGTAVTGVVLAHIATGGVSTKGLAYAANAGADGLANLVQAVSPAAAQFIRDAAPDIARGALELAQAPFDAVKTFVTTTAAYRNIKLDENSINAAAYAITGHPMHTLLASQGIEADPIKLGQIIAESQKQPDPQAYLREQLAKELNMSKERVAEVMRRTAEDAQKLAQENLDPETLATIEAAKEKGKAVLDNTAERTRSAFGRLKVGELDDQGVTNLFNRVSSNTDMLGMGMMGKIVFGVMGFLSSLFGGVALQKFALNMFDVEGRVNRMVEAGKNNELAAAFGDRFSAITGPATRTAQGPTTQQPALNNG